MISLCYYCCGHILTQRYFASLLARRCSFAYEVANAGYRWDAARKLGSFTFSAGGQQCNRQETQHGPLIIENVAEELDAPSEFFFNTTTKVLTFWYNATAGTPPPTDVSIVAPSLTTLLAARGTQAAPVKAVTLRKIGIRDTAPTVMFPHVGPSGGDWSINRYAAVVAEGVEVRERPLFFTFYAKMIIN